MPAGPLREKLTTSLQRADAILWIGPPSTLPQWAQHKPRFCATFRPHTSLTPGTPVWGFAGIGYPAKFHKTLEKLGLVVQGFQAFPDHYPYTLESIQTLRAHSDAAGSRLVTTEKDAVRLPEITEIDLVSLTVEWENPSAIHCFLKDYLGAQKGSLCP